jgi:hypothetical protein
MAASDGQMREVPVKLAASQTPVEFAEYLERRIERRDKGFGVDSAFRFFGQEVVFNPRWHDEPSLCYNRFGLTV